MAKTYQGIAHPFAPVWDAQARALVLGTFPSVRSRENAFYYGHPQNRFWRMLAMLYAQPEPMTVAEKTTFLIQNRIALWDVLASCDITGSADQSIRQPVPNDIAGLLAQSPGMQVFANGQMAAALYRRHIEPCCGVPIQPLPSTSPANAAWSLARLLDAWQPLRIATQRP